MKNIPAFAVLVIMFVLIPPGTEAESAFGFSIEPSFGILLGKAEEIVYKKPDSDALLSQLLWELRPLVYAGMDLEFGPRRPWIKSGFFAEAAIKYGLPLKTGSIEDRDWQAPGGQTYLTNFSKHDSYLEKNGAIFADLSAGYSWALPWPIYIRAFADFSYIRLAWNSRDGYIQYAPLNEHYEYDEPWNENLPKIPHNGPAINYQQNWLLLSPGLLFGFQGSEHFSISVFALVTPLIRSVNIDEHMASQKIVRYEDYLYGGVALKYGTEISFSPSRRWEFLFAADLQRINGSRGSTYEKASTSSYYSEHPDGGGGGFMIVNLGLSAKLHF
ncbi:omptin family outer membrane protease [Leadbettera azotonutricia]|uniref:Uncharacterized protein n=1 Tax=Leadbettera azotonutricia (strain ATCC BAA-888 / DSM 13862 / ZAS-9) TaxID=545695 RepID=F5YAY9_LEAAZ|nr:omptin family outer membrane protease [Leadbettera azotonutricia]AEF81830.1 hypothetical protein TREAZ_0641 [Leadbettera azotonutricia ZAS-9]